MFQVGSERKLQGPSLTAEGIWEAAWKPLELKKPAKGSLELHESDSEDREEGAHVTSGSGSHANSGTRLRHPLLALQGIHPGARRQLLAIALATLERHVAALPDQALRCVPAGRMVLPRARSCWRDQSHLCICFTAPL